MDRATARRRTRTPSAAALLEGVCDRLPTGYALFDADLRLVASNARFAALRGYPRKLVTVGAPLEQFVRFDAERGEFGAGGIDALTRSRFAALKRGRPAQREQSMRDGRILRIRCERLAAGRLLLTCEDVTAARRATERLRESEERYGFAMRAINEGVYDWDIARGRLYCSDRIGTMIGLSREELAMPATFWAQRAHPDDLPKLRSAFLAHVKGETERFECDYRYRSSDGAWRWARQHGVALRDTRGRAYRMVGSAGDITELKEREHRLAEQTAEQMAVRELLEAISRSAFDLDAVLRTLVESATRLCRAEKGFLFRLDGDAYRLAIDCGGATAAFREFVARHPIRAGRETLVGRTALERRAVHIEDVLADREYDPLQYQRIGGFRTMLGVPIMRDEVVIGVISLWKERVEPFTDAQIGFLTTFSREAAIAIENARLFQALNARNRELTETLEHETATATILRAINSSPPDVQSVLDTVAHGAARLCDASNATIFRVDGDVLRLAASHGPMSTVGIDEGIPINRGSVTGRSVVDGQTIHVHDLAAADEAEFPVARAYARGRGYRTALATPLLREGRPVGTIHIRRGEARPFSGKQIRLLETFANQAAIAIENARLFEALQGRTRELGEALDIQTATSDALKRISRSGFDLQPVLLALIEVTARLCRASQGVIYGYDGAVLRPAAYCGFEPEFEKVWQRVELGLDRTSGAGRAALERQVVDIPDVLADPEYGLIEGQRLGGWRSLLCVPLLQGNRLLGVIALSRNAPNAFTDQQVRLTTTFADQAVIAIENVRLFKELQARNHDLTEALEQQTATAEILQAITRSPTDIESVLDTLVRSVARLCKADSASLFRVEGHLMRRVAGCGSIPGSLRVGDSRPIGRGSLSGRAILDRQILHVADFLETDLATEFPDIKSAIETEGVRTCLAAPLVREGRPIGALTIFRTEVRPFSAKQIELVRTFADQAVISIENVRLFHELEARTAELARSVEELRALGEVGQAVSSTLDLQTVLTTIVSRASDLSGTDGGAIYEYDEPTEELQLRATRVFEQALGNLRLGEGATGRAAAGRKPVQIPDVLADEAYPGRLREFSVRSRFRAALAVPLLREDRILGALVVVRKSPGAFPGTTIELLQTFASQSALAIHNARLFREIEAKRRELEIANRHKSQFLASMSHELRTPLNSIIGFSDVLLERMFGELNERQAEYLDDIRSSGEHLLSLINDVLDLSKIEAGRMELALSTFDPGITLENTVTLMRERAARGGIELDLEVDERLAACTADERKFKQIVLNLLSNALKFTPQGGEVKVRARRTDDGMEVAVADSGVGIAPDERALLFEEFRQAGTEQVEGTGLGLALTKKFVELHAGRIWVESEKGKGSTFFFTLPLQRRVEA